MCTSFLLKGSDNGCVYGRTKEMGLPMRAQVTLIPRNYATKQMTNVAWHIVGSFDIPPGAITLPLDNPYGGGAGGIEITEWSAVADNKNMIYNVKMYETMNIYTFDLKKAEVNAKEIAYLKLDKPQTPVLMN